MVGCSGTIKQIHVVYPDMVSTVNMLLRNYTAQVSFVTCHGFWVPGGEGGGGGGGCCSV